MLFSSFFLALFATLAAVKAQSDSCAAGSILGIYAMCGSFPVDCGKGLCCLQGQKCVSGGCTDPKLTDDQGKVLTVNAACYGTMLDHMTPPSSSVTSAAASFVTNPATIATPTKAVNIGAEGSSTTVPLATNTGAQYTNGTSTGSGQTASATGSGTSSTTSPELSNGATSEFATPVALLLSAVAIVAFCL